MNNIPLTTSDSVERSLKKSMTGCVVKLRAMSVHIGVFWLILVSVEGWTYHSDNTAMTWNEAREWCQKHYTDIVVIHNENVTHFLKQHLESRSSSPYYWIGLQKINGNWTWVANGQIMNYENWADDEPNNALSDENCVEMNSNTGNHGKWNDDGCSKQKYPVCHKAQCLNNSCSNNGLCKEQVNNFTCVCKPGFSGAQCETVVSCEQLSAPPHGWMKCSGLYGNHSLNSNCTFSCAGGYKLSGTAELKCNSSGVWNAPQPSCAVECFPLLLFGGGMMNCTEGPDRFRSDCRVQCPPGRLLLGITEFTCRADGMWESSFPLMCATAFGSKPSSRSSSFLTQTNNDNNKRRDLSTSLVHFQIALLASVLISVFCGCFCCRKKKKAVGLRTQQEMLNPAFEAEHTQLDGPLCSA